MKKNIFKIWSIVAIFATLVSCDEEATITKLGQINFPRTLTTDQTTAVVTKDNGDSYLATFKWDAVSYGIKAAVTYTLQFDTPADTLGSTPWASAQELVVGDDILTRSITASELNQIAKTGLGLEAGVGSKVVVRVKSYVDRAAYSNAITLNVTPWEAPVVVPTLPTIWVPGDYQAWDPASAATLVSANSDNMYEGYVYFPAGGNYQFKFTPQASWSPTIYVNAGNGAVATGSSDGANCSVATDGYYELSLNLNTLKWTATKTTWGIIGDATPSGWNSDTPMIYDPVNKVWSVTCDMVSTGSFKFRANGAWAIDFGVDSNGKIKYADNPLYPYDGTLSNLTVPTSGNYTITLDLHTAGNYTFKLKKN